MFSESAPRHFGDLRRLDHQRQQRTLRRGTLVLLALIIGFLLSGLSIATYTGCQRAPAFCGGVVAH